MTSEELLKSRKELEDQGLVKVFFPGESMWVKPIIVYDDYLIGILDNKPVSTDQHGCVYRDLITAYLDENNNWVYEAKYIKYNFDIIGEENDQRT